MLLIQDVKHSRVCLKADRSSKPMAPCGLSKDGTIPQDTVSP